MELLLIGLIPPLLLLLAIAMIVVNQIAGFVQFRRFSMRERSHNQTISDYMKRMGLASSQLARRSRQLEDFSRRLRLNNDELARLNTLKTKFLSMAVHDMRTPLTSVRGFSDMLGRSPRIGPSEKKHLAYIKQAADQIQLLMGDLTDLALIEAGKYKLSMAPFLLEDMVQDIAPGIQFVAQAKGVQFQVVEMPAGTEMLADRFRLGRVLQNLLGNAVKFTPGGGRVELRGRLSGRWVSLSVKDTGPGIHPTEKKKIFEKFYQSRHMKDMTAKAAGWGLGLAIADEIVRGHGGEIGVDSPGIGKGSTFSVRVPLVPPRRLLPGRAARAAVSALLLFCSLAPGRARAQNIPLDEKAKFEKTLEERVEGVIVRILGPNRAKVVIDAELDFSRIEKFESKDGGTTAQTVRRTPYLWEAPPTSAQKEILPGVVADESGGAPGAPGKPQAYEKLNTFPTDFVKKLSVTVILDRGVETQMSDDIRGILTDILAITPVRGDSLTIVHAPFAPVWKTIWYSPEMAWLVVKYLLVGTLSMLTLLVVSVSLMRMSDAMRDMAQAQSQHYSMDVRGAGGEEMAGEPQGQLEGGKPAAGEEGGGEKALALPGPGDDVRFLVRPDQIEVLSEMVGGEKPDNIALIAAHMAPELRDQLLAVLPEGVGEQVLISLGRVRFVEPEVLLNLKEELERRLSGAVGGIGRLVRMIESSDFTRRNQMIETIAARDPELGRKLRERVFVLESLAVISETEWSLLLGKVPYEDWALALADGPETVSVALIAHLPGNAAKVVAQMIEAKPGDKAARQAAQERLARTVSEMIAQGLLNNPAQREAEKAEPASQEN